MNWKRTMFLIFFIVAGILLGGLVGEVSKDVSWLSWLGYSADFGISADAPARIDLGIIQIIFGFNLAINVAQVLFIGIMIFMYKKFISGAKL